MRDRSDATHRPRWCRAVSTRSTTPGRIRPRSGRPDPPATDDEAWIWSDLHLGDDTAIEHGNRPFENTEAMNASLLDGWRRCLDADHTIVNLGTSRAP